MIVYLETSALLKMYVMEAGSERVRELVSTASITCTHVITYVEACAALAQAVRMDRIDGNEHADHARALAADWPALQTIAVDEPLVKRAAEHAVTYGLHGYDSVHLAAAERVFDGAGKPSTFGLSTFDADLRAGAAELGIPILA